MCIGTENSNIKLEEIYIQGKKCKKNIKYKPKY